MCSGMATAGAGLRWCRGPGAPWRRQSQAASPAEAGERSPAGPPVHCRRPGYRCRVQGVPDSARALTGARYGVMTPPGRRRGSAGPAVIGHDRRGDGSLCPFTFPGMPRKGPRRNCPPRRCTSPGRRFSPQEPSARLQTMGTRVFGERRSLPWNHPSSVSNDLG